MNSKGTKWMLGLIPTSVITCFLGICIVIMVVLGGGNSESNACEVPIDNAVSTTTGGNITASTSQKAFIEKIANAAKKDEYNIMPSLTIAQGILESAWGSSFFATDRNNLFGIGAYDSNPNSAFKFSSIDECVTYHDKILCSKPYGNGESSGIEGYYSWDNKLKKGLKPYASDPNYFEKLKDIVDKYNLTKYDDKKMANKITSTGGSKNIQINNTKKEEIDNNNCIDNSPLSSKAVSMKIDINARPYTSAGGNPYAPGNIGQCTWFAWGRFFEWYNTDPGFTGNGKDCVNQLISAHPNNFSKTSDFSKLKDHSVFSCEGGGSATSMEYGHVGCVEKVDLKKQELVVSEGNVDGKSHVVNTWSFSAFKKRYPNGLVFAVPKN